MLSGMEWGIIYIHTYIYIYTSIYIHIIYIYIIGMYRNQRLSTTHCKWMQMVIWRIIMNHPIPKCLFRLVNDENTYPYLSMINGHIAQPQRNNKLVYLRVATKTMHSLERRSFHVFPVHPWHVHDLTPYEVMPRSCKLFINSSNHRYMSTLYIIYTYIYIYIYVFSR